LKQSTLYADSVCAKSVIHGSSTKQSIFKINFEEVQPENLS